MRAAPHPPLRSQPAEVWAALTETDSIERWLARVVSIELCSGGAWELALGVAARVREPERVLELDWRRADEDPSVVRLELPPDGDGTLLILDHHRIDARFGMAYISRWMRALGRLEREVAR